MSSNRLEKSGTEIRDSGFFVLRTPLLPFDDFLNWSAELTAPATLDNPEQLSSSLAKDREILRARLSEIMSQPDVLGALFLASSDLQESIEIWQRNPETDRGQRIERALVRYFSRLTGRATPFGLCAGISVGQIASQTELMLVDRKHYKRHTRLDMKYLAKLMASVALEPSFKNAHTYRPNTSLYRVANRFHYIEEERIENSWRIHRLVAVEASDLLVAALEKSYGGARIPDLVQALTGLEETTAVEAEEFVEELIDNQLLIPDFGPVITGPDPLIDSIERLKTYPDSAHLTSKLQQIETQLESIDSAGLRVPPQRYNELIGELDQLTAPQKVGRYLKVDLIKPALKMTLGRGLVNQVIRGVEILQRLATPKARVLQDFRARFVERYGQRELPLVMVLDEEVGIGFNFDRFNAPAWKLQLKAEQAPNDPNSETPGTSLLLTKVFEAQAKGEMEIRLDAEDVKLLAAKQSVPLPASFAVRAVIVKQNGADKNYRIEIKYLNGPSGANLLGRFCQTEPQLKALVDEHLRAEEKQYSDAILAEVVHLPEEAVANVLCRPLLREFEIPYLARSGAPVERQIPITDLLISVRGNRIVLRSQRLGREVVPRLTSAHNFSSNRNLAVYRFLCLLQEQGTAHWSGLNWGILKDLPFLPRVSAGQLILARAQWKVAIDELPAVRDVNATEHYVAVQEWRVKRKLPRYVAFVEGDSELIIDFDNVLSVEMFLELLKKRGAATLVERFLSESSELFASGPEGSFAGEIVIPFVNTVKQPKSVASGEAASITERSFLPGSEWLYLRVYCGPATVDRILNSLRPFVEHVITTGAADRWFYLRHNEPQWHLRLRLHGNPTSLQTRVLPQLQEFGTSLLQSGLIWNMQIDTYDREVERYGGLHGVELAEELFWADSTAALTIVNNYFGNAGADARWFLTLRSVDQMLSDFGLNTSTRHEFVCKRLKEAALPEDLAKEFKRHLSEKYRKERQAVERVLTTAIDDAREYGPGLLALQRRTERIVYVAERFRALEHEGKLIRPVSDILASFTHMNVNRLLKTDLKLQECVAYDFLRRAYEWLAAKEIKRP